MKITLNQAADKMGVTRQAVALAIQNDRIRGVKIAGRWWFDVSEVDRYVSERYNRKKTRNEDGSLRYCIEEGRYSPNLLAEACGVETSRIYYLIYSKKIEFTKIGSAYILKIKDLDSMRNLLSRDAELVENLLKG